MSHAEIKKLETRRNQIRTLLAKKKETQGFLCKEINQLLRNIKDIDSSIESIKASASENNSIVVTEHAMLRYLERVKGIDLEKIKLEIVTSEVLEQIKTLGAGTYPVKGKYFNLDKQTFRIRVRDNAVVTVLTKES